MFEIGLDSASGQPTLIGAYCFLQATLFAKLYSVQMFLLIAVFEGQTLPAEELRKQSAEVVEMQKDIMII